MDNNVSDFKPRVYIKGWGCLLLARISMMNRLEAASIFNISIFSSTYAELKTGVKGLIHV